MQATCNSSEKTRTRCVNVSESEKGHSGVPTVTMPNYPQTHPVEQADLVLEFPLSRVPPHLYSSHGATGNVLDHPGRQRTNASKEAYTGNNCEGTALDDSSSRAERQAYETLLPDSAKKVHEENHVIVPRCGELASSPPELHECGYCDDTYSDGCATSAGEAAASESRHFAGVCYALSNYAVDALREVAQMESHFCSLSENDKDFLMESIDARIAKIKEAVLTNQRFLDLLLVDQIPITSESQQDSCEHQQRFSPNESLLPNNAELTHNDAVSSAVAEHPASAMHNVSQSSSPLNGQRAPPVLHSSPSRALKPNVQEASSSGPKSLPVGEAFDPGCSPKELHRCSSGSMSENLRKWQPQHIPESIRVNNISKVRSTLRQFVRDWSDEGKEERAAAYGPLLDALEKWVPLQLFVEKKGRHPRVLCPGSGLGRLPFEVVRRGYGCQGNEFSFFMLLGSNLILNSHIAPKSVRHEDHLVQIRIPDVSPVDTIQTGHDFSMCAGEFVEVYWDQQEQWDAVLTCFFLDTAKNVLLYIRTIARLLPPNGVWANLGPLLYHFSEMPNEISIELSWEEIRQVVAQYFTLVAERWCDSYYTTNPSSMMQVQYHCIHFVAIRNDVKVVGASNPVY